ncbi:MAG: hypothetical protein QNK37_05225 [Acidobacteriota bacterium]|nr:hypothetical protein [Acidobacteriota bacterium]
MRTIYKPFTILMFLIFALAGTAFAQIPNIIGQVYWPNGDVVEDVLLEVEYMLGNCNDPSGTVWTNADGTFDLVGCHWPAGTYYVRIRPFSVNGTSYVACWTAVQFDGRYQAFVDLHLEVIDPTQHCPEFECAETN